MEKYNIPIEIISDIFWIGNYNQNDQLHPNPYLLNFGKESIIIDPGGVDDFSTVTQKILNLTELHNIKYIILHHQDPDVCGMTHFLEEMIEHPIKIVTHPNNEHFIRHYGIKSEIYDIKEHNYQLKLDSGILLDFLFTPFLHSPGSFMTYIKEMKILFSSDLFGWVGSSNWELFDNNIEKQEYSDWHLRIVPHKKVLKQVLDKIRTLDVEYLVPQHGSIIRGNETMNHLFSKLEKLNYTLKDFLGD